MLRTCAFLYGEGSYVDRFLAWDVATHTDKSAECGKSSPEEEREKAVPPSAGVDLEQANGGDLQSQFE